MSTLRETLQTQITNNQRRLNIMNSVPEDTFSFGTVAVFAPRFGEKWYYLKIGEESWIRMGSSANTAKSISEWVLSAIESNIGYFEVYEVRPQPAPIYASPEG